MRRPQMGARLALAALVLVTGVAIPWLASAEPTTTEDPNDVSGLLDIRAVEVRGSAKPRFRTLTYSAWSAARIWDRGYDIVYLDARGDEWFEHYALVYSDGERMQATLYRRRRKKSDYVVAQLSAWKPTKRSVEVKVPLDLLGIPEDRAVMLWFVKTLMTGPHCKRVCIDRAPDSGSVEFPLLDPSPEPTPSLSSSPFPPTPTP